ncbi:MAG TPA: fasciclin [Ruminiclostridium sp.]|nr:fasciclin [Ruminiclostridium sp.]
MSFTLARVIVKASNGEYLSIDDNGGLTSVGYDESRHDIIFTVPSALSGAYIQTHTRDLLSVGKDGLLKIKSNSENISTTDLFDFICLGLNKVAIRAHNGKFLSMDNNKKKLRAAGGSIGPDETFEVIVVFR